MMHAEATLEHAVRVAGSVSVRRYETHEAEKWEAFVAQCRDATFFHRIGWRELIEDVFGHRCHYLVAERDGRWSGVMPLAVIRSRLFGHALVSLPFAVYGGPAADDRESAQALIFAAANLARTLDVDYLEVRNTQTLCSEWPRQDLYVTFRKPILPDVEANMLAIPRKQRAMVRKGIKHGLRGEIDESVDRFFELYAENVHRHGTPPFGKTYFARLREVFGHNCEVLTIVDADGRPVSGVLSFYFRNEVLPYYAGETAAARDLAANDFKYWELMRRACERGVATFDYGRSKRGTGSFDFKKNWGFEPAPLAYEYRLFRGDRVPQNNPANPKYRAMIALWRRLPRRAANALGPHIVRNLG
jgi:FemAB-related protein (PEP-CTERM system-associated)